MIVARCKWCGEELELSPSADGHVHLKDVQKAAEEHYSAGVTHAEKFLFCAACWKAETGHRPCYDIDCWCECSC